MSINDTLARLLAVSGRNDSARFPNAIPLPGLLPQVMQEFAAANPGILNTPLRRLLYQSCGIAGTALGDIDFTGQWYPEEPLAVLRPCLTLAVDDLGRRWVAELPRGQRLPGPVWCVFPSPPVMVHVSDDLAGFLNTLLADEQHSSIADWLRSLSAEARVIWTERYAAARRSYKACRHDRQIRGWLLTLPPEAHVYDLRQPGMPRGWPYGLGGPSGRIYRCGRLPVFAVARPFSNTTHIYNIELRKGPPQHQSAAVRT